MVQAMGAGIGLAVCLLLGAAGDAAGGNASAARKQLESSLQVSGTITIAPDGSVQAHTLDPAAPLGEPLTRFLDASIGQWRFQPVVVEGKTVTAKVPIHLRLLAKPAEGGKVDVSIASTYFGSNAAERATDQPRSSTLTPPRYPKTAMSMGGHGTVYMLVQVARDGTVANADAEQVNLRVLGSARQLDMLRKSLTDAAVRAAKEWTFVPPTTGDAAKEDAWLVRVPVDFRLRSPGDAGGKPTGWDTYVPGPRNISIPWAQEKLQTAASPDAVPDVGIYPLRQGATLLTPPST